MRKKIINYLNTSHVKVNPVPVPSLFSAVGIFKYISC